MRLILIYKFANIRCFHKNIMWEKCTHTWNITFQIFVKYSLHGGPRKVLKFGMDHARACACRRGYIDRNNVRYASVRTWRNSIHEPLMSGSAVADCHPLPPTPSPPPPPPPPPNPNPNPTPTPTTPSPQPHPRGCVTITTDFLYGFLSCIGPISSNQYRALIGSAAYRKFSLFCCMPIYIVHFQMTFLPEVWLFVI